MRTFVNKLLFYIVMLLFLHVLTFVKCSYNEDPDCPDQEPDTPPTYLPDPDNCGGFFECFFGQAMKMKCPPGTYYSIDQQVCDYIENVDCNSRPTTISPNVTTTTTTEPPTTAAVEFGDYIDDDEDSRLLQ